MWRKLNKPLLAKIRRASREYGLIQPYDKIAVGLSGGKDSTVMLYALSVLQKTLPFPFELVGISLDVGWNNDYELVGRYCRELGVPFHLEGIQPVLAVCQYAPRRHQQPGQKARLQQSGSWPSFRRCAGNLPDEHGI